MYEGHQADEAATDDSFKVPSPCVDCGNDAYIRLAPRNGGEAMVCGRCFGQRLRKQALLTGPRAEADLKLAKAPHT